MSQNIDYAIVHIDTLLEIFRKANEKDYEATKPTIFKVDDRFRIGNERDYEPKIVSIGPIHHGKDKVKNMEQHKVRFLEELLRERDDLSLEKLVEKMRENEEDACRYYSISAQPDKEEFMGILILDGCFIIQLMRRYFSGKSNNDPIFKSETLIQIIHDLLLFENQLPFFVFSRLFDKIKTGNPDDNLSNLIMFLFGDIVPWFDSTIQFHLDQDPPHHLLGLVYRCISNKIPRKPNPSSSHDPPHHLLRHRCIIPCKPNPSSSHTTSQRAEGTLRVIHTNSASELKDIGGIDLKMSEDNHLTFKGKVLTLPPLLVYGETESLLRNLMAYEQLQLGDNQPRHVIDYLFFLHCLARSIKDVEILRYGGVIKNYLGGDEKIIQMFDRLGTNFMRSSDYTYSHVFQSLNDYCKNRRHQYMASLMRTYFNTPWSVAKVSAATLLLLLAASQTYIGLLSYQKQKK